jgi:hypothetical protein
MGVVILLDKKGEKSEKDVLSTGMCPASRTL